MQAAAEVLALASTAALWGAMLGFAFFFAPLVFIKLPGETAGGFIRAVFPFYYLMLLGLTALAALGFALLDPLRAAALGVSVLATIYARQLLMPAINRHRDASLAGDAGAAKTFDLLHRLSVVINFVQLAVVAWALWWFLA